jgi:hypothetical protein
MCINTNVLIHWYINYFKYQRLNFKERESTIWFMSQGGWRSHFTEDHSISAGALAIIANIAQNSITSFKDRNNASRKFFIALVDAQIRGGKKPSDSVLEEVTRMKAEIAAESKARGAERS